MADQLPPLSPMAALAPAASAPSPAPPSQDDAENKEGAPKKVEDHLKGRIKTAKKNRKTYYSEWKENVETRLGKPSDLDTPGVNTDDNDAQSEVNPDWSLTKTKTANLFSQVPMVQGTHEHKQYATAVSPFMKSLNYELSDKRANAGAMMEEAMNDMVNAAGFGCAYIGYSALFQTEQVPALDVKTLPPGVADTLIKAGKMPMKPMETVASDRFFMHRVSPVDALWPAEFVGSDFNQADFAGHSGTYPWSVAKHEFNLLDDDKDQVLAATEPGEREENLNTQTDKGALSDTRVVKYDEIFYWRYRFDPEETSFSAIWRLVFVQGKEKAVIHGPWKGQKRNSKGKIIGATKFPVQFGTLTYITDNAIPPSDTSATRPQVQDMRRSRSQMFQNRANSTPLRWFNVNLVGTEVQDNLMKGVIQGMLPMNGDGARAVGEVARASYPAEDLTFDQNNKQDMIESWQLQPTLTQMGGQASGRTTKAEAQANQQNFATRIGQERGRVAQFFLNCCEVLAGLMALYSDFPILADQEKQQMLQVWNDKEILADLVLKIRPDSAIVLDTGSRLDRIFKFINMTAKSGYVNVKPLITEACELSGFDPSEIVVDPQPKPPDDPNISYRFSGKDDLMNPIVMAQLIHMKKAPSLEEIEQAKELLTAMQLPPQPTPAPGAPAQAGAPGQPGPGGHPPPPGPPGHPVVPHPSQTEAHPDWQIASKVAKRTRDATGG